jgi:hypothetical protein
MPTAANLLNTWNGVLPHGQRIIYTIGNTLNRVPKPNRDLHHHLVHGNNCFSQRDTLTGHLSGTILLTDIANHMTTIENCFLPGGHGTAMQDVRWQTMYQRANRNIPFMDHLGIVNFQVLPSYPCHYCGIVLPEELIQVDHRQPQNWPDAAVIKLMHSIPGHPYTYAGATGTKGQNIGVIAAGVGGYPIVNVHQNHAFGGGLGPAGCSIESTLE